MPSPRFTDDTLAFLQSLRNNNDREWFQAHRTAYETHVRSPMVEVIKRMAEDLPAFAPELVASPRISMYRIHRDTRFSPDKSPFKTQVAAVFPHRALSKLGGAGLYFHVASDHVLVGGGVYAPDSYQLHQIRTHVADQTTRFRTIVESATFRRHFGAVGGERLRRVPRGFDADHPAAGYLKLRQFLAVSERPAAFATRPRFYGSLRRLFVSLVPFIRFLNEALTASVARFPNRPGGMELPAG